MTNFAVRMWSGSNSYKLWFCITTTESSQCNIHNYLAKMKSIPYFLFLLLGICFAAGGCNLAAHAQQADPPAQYRDTLVGRFNGTDIDTLICEPIDSLSPSIDEDDIYGGRHYKWRVYTTNNTVKSHIIGGTIGINFVKEGDLDGNGTEEWGFITDWPSSYWTNYRLFTCINGEWQLLIEPTIIRWDHLFIEDEFEGIITIDAIAQPTDRNGYVHIKYSTTDEEVTDFFVADTIVKVDPKPFEE